MLQPILVLKTQPQHLKFAMQFLRVFLFFCFLFFFLTSAAPLGLSNPIPYFLEVTALIKSQVSCLSNWYKFLQICPT